MATNAEINAEEAAPTLAVDLTLNQLELAMKLATANEVACSQASLAVQMGVGSAADVTLAPKLRDAWAEARSLSADSPDTEEKK